MNEWVWGVRRQVSLLLAHGHHHAQFYPLRRVFEEAQLVVERENSLEALRARLTNQAVSAVISKKASDGFERTMKDMADG